MCPCAIEIDKRYNITESRYGTKASVTFLETPFLGSGVLEASASAEITLPRVVSDLLMLAPSFSRAPVAPVELALSLPARSTRLLENRNS